jgi:hypothetical protein
METEWEQAPEEVVALMKELVEKHHPTLRNARIGVLFRWTGVMKNNRLQIGNASKVTGKMQALLDEKLDFLIGGAADGWLEEATPKQQRALLDHEVCHCYMGEKPELYGHDIEEFAVIVERHGLDWRGDGISERFARAVQQRPLPFVEVEYGGDVIAIDPKSRAMAERALRQQAAD